MAGRSMNLRKLIPLVVKGLFGYDCNQAQQFNFIYLHQTKTVSQVIQIDLWNDSQEANSDGFVKLRGCVMDNSSTNIDEEFRGRVRGLGCIQNPDLADTLIARSVGSDFKSAPNVENKVRVYV